MVNNNTHPALRFAEFVNRGSILPSEAARNYLKFFYTCSNMDDLWSTRITPELMAENKLSRINKINELISATDITIKLIYMEMYRDREVVIIKKNRNWQEKVDYLTATQEKLVKSDLFAAYREAMLLISTEANQELTSVLSLFGLTPDNSVSVVKNLLIAVDAALNNREANDPRIPLKLTQTAHKFLIEYNDNLNKILQHANASRLSQDFKTQLEELYQHLLLPNTPTPEFKTDVYKLQFNLDRLQFKIRSHYGTSISGFDNNYSIKINGAPALSQLSKVWALESSPNELQINLNILIEIIKHHFGDCELNFNLFNSFDYNRLKGESNIKTAENIATFLIYSLTKARDASNNYQNYDWNLHFYKCWSPVALTTYVELVDLFKKYNTNEPRDLLKLDELLDWLNHTIYYYSYPDIDHARFRRPYLTEGYRLHKKFYQSRRDVNNRPLTGSRGPQFWSSLGTTLEDYSELLLNEFHEWTRENTWPMLNIQRHYKKMV